MIEWQIVIIHACSNPASFDILWFTTTLNLKWGIYGQSPPFIKIRSWCQPSLILDE